MTVKSIISCTNSYNLVEITVRKHSFCQTQITLFVKRLTDSDGAQTKANSVVAQSLKPERDMIKIHYISRIIGDTDTFFANRWLAKVWGRESLTGTLIGCILR